MSTPSGLVPGGELIVEAVHKEAKRYPVIPKPHYKDWRRVQRIITKANDNGTVIRDIRITHSNEDKQRFAKDGIETAPAYIGITDLVQGCKEKRKDHRISILLDDGDATMPRLRRDSDSKYSLHSNALVSVPAGGELSSTLASTSAFLRTSMQESVGCPTYRATPLAVDCR